VSISRGDCLAPVVTDSRRSATYAHRIAQHENLDMAISPATLDDLDYRLISLLRTDGRMPVAKVAAHLEVSRATVTSRMERLENSGFIAGYTVQLAAQT